jgi:hypothetical protein
MDNLKNAMVYVSADGDAIGQKVGRAALADDEASLHSISEHIEAGNEVIRDFARKHRGDVISSGGDELNMKLPLEAVQELETLRSDYSFTVGATLTLGVGESLSQASKALQIGKLRGKDQICQYDDSVEQEWAQDVQNANEDESKKIGDAYMKDNKKPADMTDFPKHPENGGKSQDDSSEQQAEDVNKSEENESGQKSSKGQSVQNNDDNGPKKDESGQESGQSVQNDDNCPYCNEESGQEELGEDPCPYCSDEDQSSDQNSDTSDCPYCEESHAEDAHVHGDDCQHCQELDNADPQDGDARLSVGDQSVNPDSVNAPAMEEDGSGGENAFDGTPSEQEDLAQQYPGKNASPMVSAPDAQDKPAEPFAEEHKSPEDVLNEFDEVHGDPSEEGDAKFEQIDDTGIAEAGDGQQDNVSRPDDYNEEIPMGSEDPNNTAGSDEPNYGYVMQQDLDNNSDDIAKERAGNMVREALMNFKNTKQYLEQAQAQAPDFYAANVSMLRALIEMAKLLGFGGQQDDAQGAPPELGQEESSMIPDQAQSAEPDMADPFPKHPDNGGEESDDDSQEPERKQTDWSTPFPAHPENQNSDMGDAKDDQAGKPKAPPKA